MSNVVVRYEKDESYGFVIKYVNGIAISFKRMVER